MILYYGSDGDWYVCSYDKPAHKIMDKIAEHETNVCMVVVSNDYVFF